MINALLTAGAYNHRQLKTAHGKAILTEERTLQAQDGMALDSLPRWLRDFIDYNNEVAGRETGRASRFLSSSSDHKTEAEKKEEERRFDALLRLLQNADYARLYIEATDIIRRADDAAERALERVTREGEIALERIAALKDKAAELADGRKVFRAKDGRLIAEDGTDVTAQKESIKGLSADTPSWEEFELAQEAANDTLRRKQEIERYQRDVLSPSRLRLSDTENPPTHEELREIIERTKRTMPLDVRSDFEVRGMERNEPAARLDAPEVIKHFRESSSVIPEDAFDPPAHRPSGNSPKSS